MAAHATAPTGSASTPPRFAGHVLLNWLDYEWQVLLCVVVGTFMVMLDQTVVTIALPTITNVLAVPVQDSQLVITGYGLALAVIMPATGYLSDAFGTRRLYLLTVAVFTGGSLLCALAWNNSSLVAFRVIQGLGGGMMGPLGMTMLFQVVPPHRRNTIMGFMGLPLMLAPLLGPSIGGYIVEYVDWRMIFTLNVPIGVLGLAMGSSILRETARVVHQRFDLRGFLLSAVGYSALLLAFSEAATSGWANSSVHARLCAGGVALIGWVWVELTDPHPLIDLRLLKIRSLALSLLVGYVVSAGMFGGMLVLPLFLQGLRGLGAAETGLILMFQVLPMILVVPTVGRLVDRFGARAVILAGVPLLALSTWQMSALDLATGDKTLALWLVARGGALGLVMMPPMTAALSDVPAHLVSRASSLTNTTRQVFTALGTATIVTVLQQRQVFHSMTLAQTVTPENYAMQQLISAAESVAVKQALDTTQAHTVGLIAAARQVALSAAVMAFDDVFRVTALVTLLAIVPALFLSAPRRIPPASVTTVHSSRGVTIPQPPVPDLDGAGHGSGGAASMF